MRGPTPRQAAAAMLRAAGWSYRRIAAALGGVSVDTVYNDLRAVEAWNADVTGKPRPAGRSEPCDAA